jgi:hypothetical protein
MKKSLLLIAFSLVFSFAIFAQTNIVLSKDGVPYTNGTTIVKNDYPLGSAMDLFLDVQNTGASSIDVKCRVTPIQQVSGSVLGVCWGGSCTEPAPHETDPTTIAAGATTSEFHAEYKHNGNFGLTSVRYTFFNATNNNDSVCVVCNYEGYLSIEESTPSFSFSDAYPNPANNSVVFTYQLGNCNNAKVVIRDLLGKEVANATIGQQDGKLRINTDQLINGVYFYSVVVDDKIITTKKLVIRH